MLTLPFPGHPVSPGPALQFALWLALGRDPHDPGRPRVMKDAKGYDCNDYAYDAVQALKAGGRDPYYVDCKTETDDQHMIAAYATTDGTIYARDNRASGDLPLEELVVKGYVLEASSHDGELWRAAA